MFVFKEQSRRVSYLIILSSKEQFLAPRFGTYFLQTYVISGNENVIADDLNIFNKFPHTSSPTCIWNDLERTREKIHEWGHQNRVILEASKEFMTILHPGTRESANFKLLGCLFDVRLNMEAAIDAIVGKVRPKLKSLLRTRAFYMTDDLVVQYKAHILTLMEVHTGAISTTTTTTTSG